MNLSTSSRWVHPPRRSHTTLSPNSHSHLTTAFTPPLPSSASPLPLSKVGTTTQQEVAAAGLSDLARGGVFERLKLQREVEAQRKASAAARADASSAAEATLAAERAAEEAINSPTRGRRASFTAQEEVLRARRGSLSAEAESMHAALKESRSPSPDAVRPPAAGGEEAGGVGSLIQRARRASFAAAAEQAEAAAAAKVEAEAAAAAKADAKMEAQREAAAAGTYRPSREGDSEEEDDDASVAQGADVGASSQRQRRTSFTSYASPSAKSSAGAAAGVAAGDGDEMSDEEDEHGEKKKRDEVMPPDDRLRAISEAGGIAPLIYQLSTGSVIGKEKAACALWHLALDGFNQSAIARANGIPPLVSLLDFNEGTEQTFIHAADALARLAVDDEENQAQVRAHTHTHTSPRLISLPSSFLPSAPRLPPSPHRSFTFPTRSPHPHLPTPPHPLATSL